MTAIRMMTFNIRGADFPDGINAWEHRAPLNVAVIRKIAPDVIGFQEFQPGNHAVYQQHLPDYEYTWGPAVARENEANPYYCAIGWRRSRFELVEQGEFFLSTTPEVYSRDWGIGHGRGVNWLKLRDRETALTFLVANTHLPHDSEAGRINGARLIVSRLENLSDQVMPVFLTGDFNSFPTVYQEIWRDLLTDRQQQLLDANRAWYSNRNQVYEVFKAAGYVDSYLEAGSSDTPQVTSAHSFLLGEDLLPLNARIDWILCRGNSKSLRFGLCAIVTDAQPPLFPSDHFPVFADIDVL